MRNKMHQDDDVIYCVSSYGHIDTEKETPEKGRPSSIDAVTKNLLAGIDFYHRNEYGENALMIWLSNMTDDRTSIYDTCTQSLSMLMYTYEGLGLLDEVNNFGCSALFYVKTDSCFKTASMYNFNPFIVNHQGDMAECLFSYSGIDFMLDQSHLNKAGKDSTIEIIIKFLRKKCTSEDSARKLMGMYKLENASILIEALMGTKYYKIIAEMFPPGSVTRILGSLGKRQRKRKDLDEFLTIMLKRAIGECSSREISGIVRFGVETDTLLQTVVENIIDLEKRIDSKILSRVIDDAFKHTRVSYSWNNTQLLYNCWRIGHMPKVDSIIIAMPNVSLMCMDLSMSFIRYYSWIDAGDMREYVIRSIKTKGIKEIYPFLDSTYSMGQMRHVYRSQFCWFMDDCRDAGIKLFRDVCIGPSVEMDDDLSTSNRPEKYLWHGMMYEKNLYANLAVRHDIPIDDILEVTQMQMLCMVVEISDDYDNTIIYGDFIQMIAPMDGNAETAKP